MAPFKLRFFKSSKSRGSDEGQCSRDSSVEVEEAAAPESSQYAELNQLGLGSSESVASAQMMMMTADASSMVSANTDSTMPASSPPPSYERVLEETKLAKTMAEGGSIGETSGERKSARKKTVLPQRQGQEILPALVNYKSSKEFYKAMAKEWGITCKMSDNCRCLDCQSGYLDCGYDKYQDYDYKYQEQSDGGLSASTPMFVQEVMHGSACHLL